MALTWNKQQQQVIDFQQGNLLVSAAAGSGKTAVLTAHVMQKITNIEAPVDIDQLLVMTFTNAAATEMRERIRSTIHEQLQTTQDSRLATRLRRQLNLLPHASISTVHSFCSSVIREHFYCLGLEPGFRVGDATELDLMLSDTIEERLEELYETLEIRGEEMEPYRALLLLMESKDNKQISGAIGEVYKYSQSYPYPEAFWQQLRDFYETPDLQQLEALLPLLYEKELGKLTRARDVVDALVTKVRCEYPDSINIGTLEAHANIFRQACAKASFRESVATFVSSS